MVRRYNEPVEVKARKGMPCAPGSVEFDALAGAAVNQPEAFIWRGRLYVVREVLGRWRERRAWWREALDPPAGQPHGIAAAAQERQIWRVEASPGRLARSGVFDLARDDPADDTDATEATEDTAHVAGFGSAGWQLLRLAD